MNADFSFKEETDAIIGPAFCVLNEIGDVFYEKPYENAHAVVFRHRDIPYLQQPRYPIIYREVQVSEFVPDLIAFGKIIVDAKVIDRITDQEIGQVLNYSKITGLPVGFILNFKNSKLEFRRVFASTQNFIRRKQS